MWLESIALGAFRCQVGGAFVHIGRLYRVTLGRVLYLARDMIPYLSGNVSFAHALEIRTIMAFLAHGSFCCALSRIAISDNDTT